MDFVPFWQILANCLFLSSQHWPTLFRSIWGRFQFNFANSRKFLGILFAWSPQLRRQQNGFLEEAFPHWNRKPHGLRILVNHTHSQYQSDRRRQDTSQYHQKSDQGQTQVMEKPQYGWTHQAHRKTRVTIRFTRKKHVPETPTKGRQINHHFFMCLKFKNLLRSCHVSCFLCPTQQYFFQLDPLDVLKVKLKPVSFLIEDCFLAPRDLRSTSFSQG